MEYAVAFMGKRKEKKMREKRYSIVVSKNMIRSQ